MSVTTILSRDVVFEIASVSGGPYSTVVCKKLYNVTLDKSLIQDESDCGVHTAVGVATKWSFDAEIILNTAIVSGETSGTDIAEFCDAGTKVWVTVSTSNYSRSGGGYITNYKESSPLNGFLSATFTFTGDGAISIS